MEPRSKTIPVSLGTSSFFFFFPLSSSLHPSPALSSHNDAAGQRRFSCVITISGRVISFFRRSTGPGEGVWYATDDGQRFGWSKVEIGEASLLFKGRTSSVNVLARIFPEYSVSSCCVACCGHTCASACCLCTIQCISAHVFITLFCVLSQINFFLFG